MLTRLVLRFLMVDRHLGHGPQCLASAPVGSWAEVVLCPGQPHHGPSRLQDEELPPGGEAEAEDVTEEAAVRQH